MSIVSHAEGKNKPEIVRRFFKEWKIGSLLREAGISKEKGVPALRIFEFVFLLVFQNTALYSAFEQDVNKKLGFAKDTVYRFLESASGNWERFLLFLSAKIIHKKVSPLTGIARRRAIVFDDSVYERPRSKKVELLSRVYDHAEDLFKRGFSMLVMGWTDGNTFLPLATRLLASAKKSNRYCEARDDLDRRTNGAKRRQQATESKPVLVLAMLKQALQAGIEASLVLFDSWYAIPELLHQIHQLGLDVITRLKANHWLCYHFRNQRMTLESLYRLTAGAHRHLYSVRVGLCYGNTGIPARIVFLKTSQVKRGWVALLSTDMTLDDSEIIRMYGKRWDIEVFFKICKSALSLEKGIQVRNYDAIVAYTSIVFTRYIMLSLHARLSQDMRSWGDLLFQCYTEMIGISFQLSLSLLLDAVARKIADSFSISLNLVKQAIAELDDACSFNGFAQVRVCES